MMKKQLGLGQMDNVFGSPNVRLDILVDIQGRRYSHRVLKRSEDEDVFR